MDETTLYTLGLAAIGAIGSGIKMYFDYRAKKDAQEKADRAEARAHELELIKAKSDATIRATIVGVERHKQTLTPERQKELAKMLEDAAIEESAEEFLAQRVDEVTKTKGTKHFSPEELKKKLDE